MTVMHAFPRLRAVCAVCVCSLSLFGGVTEDVGSSTLSLDGVVTNIASEAELGISTNVVLKDGGGVAFGASAEIVKNYLFDGTGVVSAAGGTVLTTAPERLAKNTFGHVLVKRGAGTLFVLQKVDKCSTPTRWILEEGILLHDGFDLFGNHASTTTNLAIDVREGAVYKIASGSHSPVGTVELTGGTFDASVRVSGGTFWGNTALKGGVTAHPSATPSRLLFGKWAHLQHVTESTTFTVEAGAVLQVLGILTNGWNTAEMDNVLVVRGGGDLYLVHDNGWTGGTVLEGGTTIHVSAARALSTGTVTVTGDVTISVAAGTTFVCPPLAVEGGHTLTVTGGGAVVLPADIPAGLTVVNTTQGIGNAVQNGKLLLNGGVVTVDVPAGETCTLDGFETAAGALGGRSDLVKTGAGTLVLPDGGNAESIGRISVKGGAVQIAAESNLGAKGVLLTNDGRLRFSSACDLWSHLVTVSGEGGFEVLEGLEVKVGTNQLHFADSVFTKTGAGELTFRDTYMMRNAGPTVHVVVHEGVLNLRQDPWGGHATSPQGVLEVHAGAEIVSAAHVPVGRVIMRGGLLRHVRSSVMWSGGTAVTAPVEEYLAQWNGFSLNGTVEVHPSSDGSPAVIRQARTYLGHVGSRTVFDVKEGAQLRIESRLENGYPSDASLPPLPSGFTKTGAGELVLEAAMGGTGPVDVAAGTLTIDRNGSVPDSGRLHVGHGARVRLADGRTLAAAMTAADPFLQTADVWMDASRISAHEGDAVASVPNHGAAGGAFRKFATGTVPAAPVYRVDAINGLPALYFNGGSALVLDSYTNRTTAISVFMVAKWTEWDYNGGSGGKGHWGGGLSMSYMAATNTDNATACAFHTESANAVMNTYVSFSSIAGVTMSNPGRVVGTPYLDTVVLTPQKFACNQYLGDGVADVDHAVDLNSKALKIDLVAIGGRLGAWGTAQYAGSRYDSRNRMYFGDIGELVVFTRVLTDAERQHVSAYLKRKWFGSSAAVPTVDLPAGSVGQAVVDVPAGTGAFAGRLTAPGGGDAFVKTGAGALALRARMSGSGAVDVASGTLELSGGRVASRADVWLDVSDASSVTVDGAGLVTAVANKGRTGGTFGACPGRSGTTVPCPVYTNAAINGLNALQFDWNAGLCLQSYTNKTEPRSLHVYVVMKRTDYTENGGTGKWGGPFSFIGVSADQDDQGVVGSYHIEETLTNRVTQFSGTTQASGTIREGGLGEPHLMVSHQVCYGGAFSYQWADSDPEQIRTFISGAPAAVDIDRVLLGGRGTTGGVMQWQGRSWNSNRTWAGQLGELIVFTAAPSKTDERALLAYLRAKWFGTGDASATPPAFLSGDYGAPDFGGLGLAMEDGTALEQSGGTVALGGLTTAGAVDWTRAWSGADLADAALFAVDGDVALGRVNLTLEPLTVGAQVLSWTGAAQTQPVWTLPGRDGCGVSVRGNAAWIVAKGMVIFAR